MKALPLFVIVCVLSTLVACQPIQPPAQVDPMQAKIENAMSAAPPTIARGATLMDWPTAAGSEMSVLREGANAWTCMTDDPNSPTNDPMCLDKMWMAWLDAYMTGSEPHYTSVGLAYMLQGGSGASISDPSAIAPPPGQDWLIVPPHVMLVSPQPLDQTVFPTDATAGGPFIAWAGTPYEHLIVPVKQDAFQEADEKIRNAMSAAPLAVAEKATIMDWPAEATGDLVTLRAGDNGWTCFTDTLSTPTNDPMCLDKGGMEWFAAYMAASKPKITSVGIAYMLQGASTASNADPYATEPAAGEQWLIDPPSLMIIMPAKLDQTIFSAKPVAGGVYIMWPGTPYEHLMVLVEDLDMDGQHK